MRARITKASYNAFNRVQILKVRILHELQRYARLLEKIDIEDIIITVNNIFAII